MAYRAVDVMRCKNCNAGARYIILPTANPPHQATFYFRDGTINGKPVECAVREENHCTPPDLDAYDPSFANDGVTLGEVQILAAITGLKIDADCQKIIRDTTLGCIFCLIGLGKAILACAEPVIAKGDDFVVEPAWLQADVYQYVRGHVFNLHTDAHREVFIKRQMRKSLKKPQPPAKKKAPEEGKKEAKPKPKKRKAPAQPPTLKKMKAILSAKKRRCIKCGECYQEKELPRHSKLCTDFHYSCIYCSKYGFVERGLRMHLMSCKGERRPKNILADADAMVALVEEIKSKQDKIRARLRDRAEQHSPVSD